MLINFLFLSFDFLIEYFDLTKEGYNPSPLSLMVGISYYSFILIISEPTGEFTDSFIIKSLIYLFKDQDFFINWVLPALKWFIGMLRYIIDLLSIVIVYCYNGLKSFYGFNTFTFYDFSFNPTNLSFVYSIKFSASILFLIFIRAGLPRYRYDYLTKLGWSKFVLFSLLMFIVIYLVFSIM